MSTYIQKKSKRRLYVILGVIALLALAAAIKARSKPKGEEVQIEAAQRRVIREMVTASGKIFPVTEVKISPDVSGEIVELYVKEGDSVRAGQVLAKIRPDEYMSLVEQGEAALSTARSQREISSANVASAGAQIDQLKAEKARVAAQLEAARAAHQRNEKLKAEGVVSQAEYEATLSNLRSLESGLKAAEASLAAAENALKNSRENVRVSEFNINSAQARLRELRANLQKTSLIAPVSGVVSRLNVKKGERVVGTLQMAGTEMMRITNLNAMEVQVDVSENDILKVKIGDETDIEVDAYLGQTFKGRVSEIPISASNIGGTGAAAAAALSNDQVANFSVKILIAPESYAELTRQKGRFPFLPGMSASVSIYTQTAENALSVPLASVTVRDDDNKSDSLRVRKDERLQEVVFIAKDDNKVEIRKVQIGIQDNEYIQILSGLSEGEKVVSGPYSAISRTLKDGAAIRIKPREKSSEKN
ncbi:MAG: efflux RND transporter periplasmic adaptor subunit [Saprospiraceae bacterium]